MTPLVSIEGVSQINTPGQKNPYKPLQATFMPWPVEFTFEGLNTSAQAAGNVQLVAQIEKHSGVITGGFFYAIRAIPSTSP